MKPERIQFAPWITAWEPTAPSIRKDFVCESVDDANHYAAHIDRVARPFTATSEVKTFTSYDNVVSVKIVPVQAETLNDAQYALGQRLDEALAYLEAGSDFDSPEAEN